MRKKIVAGNWKMNTDLQEGLELVGELKNLLNDYELGNTGVVIAPPFTHLSAISKQLSNSKICLAAQNCSSENSGAYTGEISAEMLQSVGVDAVILGHSERREYFKESNAQLAKKVDQVLPTGMKIIFCVGEVLDQRQSNVQNEVVASQLKDSLFHLTAEQMAMVRIAYEPVWAIGTGLTASPDQAQEMHAFIRSILAEQFGQECAVNISILYGGSCKPSNAAELFANPDVDGGLIGGASLKAADFMDIIKAL